MMIKRWKTDLHGFGGLDYLFFKAVPMRSSKWGDVIDIHPELLEKLAAEALILNGVPIRGRELKFLRKALGFSLERLAKEIDLSDSAIFKWEHKADERLHPMTEAPLRAFFAEKLGLEIPGTL